MSSKTFGAGACARAIAAILIALSSITGAPAHGQGSDPPGEQDPPNNADDPGGDSKDKSDPIYLFNGEFHTEREDLRIPGRGFDFVWTRKYRARSGPDTAQGHRWDFSYNAYIEGEGYLDSQYVVHDGGGRHDTYERIGTTTTFECTGFFRQLRRLSNAEFELVQPDYTVWHFAAIAGSEAGHLLWIRDRNGNTMYFQYDSGKLSEIDDTLGRPIYIGYSGANLTTITDWTGRQIHYSYYGSGDPHGLPGDLKSVTYPAVTGTPNGNDFPSGKTWTYWYAVAWDFSHCLTSVFDGKGQEVVRNTWDYSPDDSQPCVTEQIYGVGKFKYTFADWAIDPAEANNFATQLTIVNDRAGNVQELYYDSANRLVLSREYTGRADPALPTTLVDNRPTGKLRAEDPDYFETRYFFNSDSMLSKRVDPNGSSTEYTYDSLNASVRCRGNELSRKRLPGVLGGDQTELLDQWTYDPVYNFIAKHTPPKGAAFAVTNYYDGLGNRQGVAYPTVTVGVDGGGTQSGWEAWGYNTAGQVTWHMWAGGRKDSFTYYDVSSSSYGALKDVIVDSDGMQLTTTYGYDTVGNITSVTDPKGNTSTRTINALNQVVKCTAPPPLGYVSYRYYDADDNLVKAEIENRDSAGVLQPNAWFTTEYEYNILNKETGVKREVDEGSGGTQWAEERYEYDANFNLTLTKHGVAVDGTQPANTERLIYDERDLLFKRTRAEGTVDATTDRFDYDGNGNAIKQWEGLESTPRVTTRNVDGFDRQKVEQDPEGNQQLTFYDADGNVVEKDRIGERTEGSGGSTAGNTLLQREMHTFDERDRLIAVDRLWFNTATSAVIGDGSAHTAIAYTVDSLEWKTTDDNGHTVQRAFDNAHRVHSVTDAAGNVQTYDYDASANVHVQTDTDVVEGSSTETHIVTNEFDALNRRTKTTDTLGHERTVGYDSRGDLVTETDARGNVTRNVYDGLQRLVRVERDVRTGGVGTGSLVDTIISQRGWDASSRLITETDDNGRVTSTAYDSLDRRTGRTNADGTTASWSYDVHGNAIHQVDENGTSITTGFDLLNRIVSRAIVRATGVLGTTTESYAYDGLSRIVNATNNDAVVVRDHDSLGFLSTETTTTTTTGAKTTSFSYDGLGNALTYAYPGGRLISATYDVLSRKDLVRDSGVTLADYAYAGKTRLHRLDYANGTFTEATYDADRRPTDVRSVHASTALMDWSFAWDASDNRTLRDNLVTGATWSYGYDSLDRLASSSVDVGPVAMNYVLDGVGNRSQATKNGSPLAYTLTATLPEPADAHVNQYTQSPEDPQYAATIDPLTYDKNGNVTQVGTGLPYPKKKVWYDFENQMVKLQTRTGDIYQYKYDAFGRRVETIQNPSGTPVVTRYCYCGNSVIEEQDGLGTTLATYVYGNGIDEVLQMIRSGQAYYYGRDDLGNVLMITSASGAVVETYDYGDFGRLLDSTTLQPGGESTVGNPFFFAGARRDVESTWYYMRHRYYMPGKARFTSRDALGGWSDPMSLGNALTYCANNPWRYVDPLGLEKFLRIWVDQPGAGGTADAHDGTDCGHVWVELIDTSSNHSLTLGLHTDGSTKTTPWSPDAPGEIRDDSEHPADVMAEFPISDEGYDAAKEKMEGDEANPPAYNLNDSNCVDWASDVACTAGVALPDAYGSWFDGEGQCPGAMGEGLMQYGGVRVNEGYEDNPCPVDDGSSGSSSGSSGSSSCFLSAGDSLQLLPWPGSIDYMFVTEPGSGLGTCALPRSGPGPSTYDAVDSICGSY